MVVGIKDEGVALERTVILGAARTPFGRFGGVLSPLSAPELGGAAIREAVDRSGVEDGEVQHSIFGIVVQAGVGQIPSRQANFVDADEPVRRDTTIEKLAKLSPIDEGGTVTAGNAPGVTDGAGALVLASESYAEKRGLEPLGTIVAHAKVAEEPPSLLTVPGNSGKLALHKAGWSAKDLDLVEINEAIAGVAIHSTRILGVNPEIVNVNGGALALGHPVGASGARILTTLFYELRRRGGGRGLAAICSGGGQGDAVLVEV